jgi:hypothetical protein
VLGGAGDERAVERARDAELDRATRALELRLAAALVHRWALAGDHDLPGAVVVRRPHVGDLGAERLDHLVGKAEDRGHRAGVLARGLGHRQAALTDEPDRIVVRECLRGGERGELADRVADDDVRLEAVLLQRGEHREAGGDEGRLLHLRVDELLLRGLEAQPDEVEAGGLARSFVHLHRRGHGEGDLPAHARLE